MKLGGMFFDLGLNTARLNADIDKAVKGVGAAGKRMAAQLRAQTKQASDSLALMGQQFGVYLPAQIRKAVAESSGLGQVMAKALPFAAAGAFAAIIGQSLAPKIKSIAEEMGGFGEQARKAFEEIKKQNQELLKVAASVAEIHKQIKLVGLEGAGLLRAQVGMVGVDIKAKEALRASTLARLESLRAEVKALQAAGGLGNFADEEGIPGQFGARFHALKLQIVGIDAELSQLRAQAQLFGAQLTHSVGKEGTAAAEKLRSALERVTKTIGAETRIKTPTSIADELQKLSIHTNVVYGQLGSFNQRFSGFIGLMREASANISPVTRELGEFATKLKEDIKTNAEKLAEGIRSLQSALGAGLITPEQYGRGLDKMRNSFDDLRIAARQAGDNISHAFREAVIHGRAFKDVLRAIAVEMVDYALKATLAASISNIFTSILTGITGLFFPQPKITNAPLPKLPDFFGGAKAHGGPVSASTAYMVGERGPELFVPNTSGAVVPNGGKLGGVTVHNHFAIDARGAQDIEKLERRLLRVALDIGKASSDATLARLQRHYVAG